MYLLTKLSASQPVTQRVCFRIPHTVYIYHKHNFKERHVGPLLKSRKSQQHVARRTLKPLDAVQKGLFLSFHVQFNSAKPKPG